MIPHNFPELAAAALQRHLQIARAAPNGVHINEDGKYVADDDAYTATLTPGENALTITINKALSPEAVIATYGAAEELARDHYDTIHLNADPAAIIPFTHAISQDLNVIPGIPLPDGTVAVRPCYGKPATVNGDEGEYAAPRNKQPRAKQYIANEAMRAFHTGTAFPKVHVENDEREANRWGVTINEDVKLTLAEEPDDSLETTIHRATPDQQERALRMGEAIAKEALLPTHYVRNRAEPDILAQDPHRHGFRAMDLDGQTIYATDIDV